MDDSYDSNKNYYRILGVENTATTDELKGAYVKLALKYHPDTSKNDDDDFVFHEISEAWSVLSKPEIRKKYDLARRGTEKSYGSMMSSASFSSSAAEQMTHHTIPSSFTTARDNYTASVKKNASSNWKDLQDKYR